MEVTPIVVTIPGATKLTGLGRNVIYQLIGAGVLDARKSGRRTVLTTASLKAYVESLPRATIRAPRQAA